MCIGRHNMTYSYTLLHFKLTVTTQGKDLEVIVNSSMKTSVKWTEAVRKTNKTLGCTWEILYYHFYDSNASGHWEVPNCFLLCHPGASESNSEQVGNPWARWTLSRALLWSTESPRAQQHVGWGQHTVQVPSSRSWCRCVDDALVGRDTDLWCWIPRCWTSWCLASLLPVLPQPVQTPFPVTGCEGSAPSGLQLLAAPRRSLFF